MITYSKEWWGIASVFQLYGSALPRAAPIALAAAALSALLRAFLGDVIQENILHPYPFQAFSFVVGFLLVFRCALCREGTRYLPPTCES